MNVVQPIRDRAVIERCYDIARAHDRRGGGVSWELILLVGFNTSLRVSDFTRFRVGDLRGAEHAQIRARKTGKMARVLINPPARRELNRLLAGRKADEYALQSRQKDPVTHRPRPVTRQRVYQIMNQIARSAGIADPIGCHTLRKTFGYHYYQQTHDVVKLQRILCHASRRETLVYIGIAQEEQDESLRNFSIVGRRKQYERFIEQQPD